MSNVKEVDGWKGIQFGKPEVGAFEEVKKELVLADIELFSALTGDRNPLHTDEKKAKASRFKGLIVQGGVTTGILNMLVAEKIPGPGTVFLSTNWNMLHPGYIGDTLTGRVEIMDVRDDKPICKIKTTVTNQDGVVCLEGNVVTYTASLEF